MKTIIAIFVSLFMFTGCDTGDTSNGEGDTQNNEEEEDEELDPNLDTDEDGIPDVQELDQGTDPELADSDEDSWTDLEEDDCGSDPLDSSDECYACGWIQNDPGTIVSTGADVGDVIDDVALPDQCGDSVRLWDFYGEYHILYMTAAW